VAPANGGRASNHEGSGYPFFLLALILLSGCASSVQPDAALHRFSRFSRCPAALLNGSRLGAASPLGRDDRRRRPASFSWISQRPSSSRKPIGAKRRGGYPGPIGRNIVERGPVLVLVRVMVFRAFHAARQHFSMGLGSARLRRLAEMTAVVFAPPKNSFIPAPNTSRIMLPSFSPGTQFATVFCGEGPAPPVCRQRSGIPGEAPSKGSPAGTTARACWTST
jgi:hypothetical protein